MKRQRDIGQYFSKKVSHIQPNPTDDCSSIADNDDIDMNDSQMADWAPSTPASNETNNGQTSDRLDIGMYVAAGAEISDDLCYKLLTACWKPNKSYTFQFVQQCNVQRKFSHNYLVICHS